MAKAPVKPLLNSKLMAELLADRESAYTSLPFGPLTKAPYKMCGFGAAEEYAELSLTCIMTSQAINAPGKLKLTFQGQSDHVSICTN